MSATVRKLRPRRKSEVLHYDNENGDKDKDKASSLPLKFPTMGPEDVQSQLRLWGVCGIRGLFTRYGLAALSEAVEEVRAAKTAASDRGEYVLNPGGLFRWVLYESYGKR